MVKITRMQAGAMLRDAAEQEDLKALENLSLSIGRYRDLMVLAGEVGVDPGELEELLARI